MSLAHHPQTDGQTERINQTLEEMIIAFVNHKQDNWDECLLVAEFAYNNSKQASTGFTPFYLDCGQHLITPSFLLTKTPTTQPAATEEILLKWKNNIQIAKDNLH